MDAIEKASEGTELGRNNALTAFFVSICQGDRRGGDILTIGNIYLKQTSCQELSGLSENMGYKDTETSCDGKELTNKEAMPQRQERRGK